MEIERTKVMGHSVVVIKDMEVLDRKCQFCGYRLVKIDDKITCRTNDCKMFMNYPKA